MSKLEEKQVWTETLPLTKNISVEYFQDKHADLVFLFICLLNQMGKFWPNSVLFCKPCLRFCLCKRDLNSCRSYSARVTWKLIPVELTATLGSMMLPVPSTHQSPGSNSFLALSPTTIKEVSPIPLMTDCTQIAGSGRTRHAAYLCTSWERKYRKSIFLFSFHDFSSLIY